jgi:hypothetical protein
MVRIPLTSEQIKLIEDYQAVMHEILRKRGFEISFHQGLEGWMEITLKNRSLVDGISPSFDPELGEVNAENSVWLLARKNGEDVGWVCLRHDWVDDYEAHIKGGRLWGPEGTPRAKPLPNYIETKIVKSITGSVVHSGGACVTIPYRNKEIAGKRLVSYFTRLLRAHGLLKFQADWLTGSLVQAKLAKLNFGTEIYGYENTVKISENYFPSMDSDRDVWLNVSSRQQQLAAFKRELELIG